MGLIALASQLILNVHYIVISKRVFPQLRFSFRLVNWQAWRRTAAYGVHTFAASVANTGLEQTPSLAREASRHSSLGIPYSVVR